MYISLIVGNVNAPPPPPPPPQNPQNPEEKIPTEEQLEQQTPPSIPRHAPGTQENLMGQIENNKKQIEDIIVRLKEPTNSTLHISTLAQSLESMLSNVDSISKQISSWSDKRREFREYYVDKLSYEDVKKLQITKLDLCSIFTNPQTNQPPPITCKRFPIHWCNNQAIRDNFGQRWWMVFDHPPCNINEVPQYFLRKLYYDFVLNKVPNYFDMRDFQGRGGGQHKIDQGNVLTHSIE
ncbi:MAG TPA: hypothetical protein VFV08_00525 [Puia sp.]|nr:hypothetical protein [Puia sp.]